MAYLIASADTARFSATFVTVFGGSEFKSYINGNDTQGLVAGATGTAATLRLSINSWGSATNLKAALYDEDVLVEIVVIPASVGTGVVDVALAGTTTITSGNLYRLALYSESGLEVTLDTDTGGLTLREEQSGSGSYTSPIDPYPAGSYDSANEFYWAIQDAGAAQTTIDDITFDVPEWIGIPEGDYTLEAEDDVGTASLTVAYELPAGWVQQVSDGTGAGNASSLAQQILDSHGITVVSGDYYFTNGNTVGADGIPPNDTAFNFRVLDTSAGAVTTEVAYVPALRIDSASNGPFQEGDTLTITHSNASASGKTYTIGGLAITEDSQNASTSVLTIPDPKTYGAKTLSYNTDLSTVVTDGAETASILRQIEPATGDFYGTITSLIGAWANAAYSAFEVGDNIYAVRTAGTGDAEVATGVFPEDTTWSIYNQDVNDGVWGTFGTLVVPSITPGGDVTKPIITLLGSATVAHAQQAPYTDAGATATDETDGTLTNDIVVSGDTVDVNTVGSYVIRYNVSDAAGNAATEVTRTVDVLADPIPPVITVTGSTSIQLVLDATYTELGATWTDNVDGAGAATVGGDTVDTSTAGTYVVTYNHTDEAGNPATQRTRTVKIGGAVSTLLVSDFPATEVVTANDLQQPLIKLHQLCRRSSAGVARQIEEHVNTIYFLMPNALTGTPPDATVAATAQLKALYVAFTGFDRAWRIKMERVRKLSANVAVQAAMAAQLQFWLEKQGWTFA